MTGMLEALNRTAAAWWDWTVASTGQGTFLLVLVAIVLFAGKSLRPGLRYGLLLVVLLKFAVPPLFGVTYGFSDLLVRTLSGDPAPTMSTSLPVSVEVSAAPVAAPRMEAAVPFVPQTPVLSRFARLLLFEAVGAALILALVLRQWTHARRLVKRSAHGDTALQDRFHGLVRTMKLRRKPRLCVSDDARAPQSGGILRPFVLLPAWAATMPEDELDILLAHELAHVKRLDALVNGAQALAQALLWWNPAVWWLNRRIREEREFCCDDLVLSRGIASGAAYSRTLVNVAERVSLPQSSWAMAGMADNFGAIDRRVRRALEGGHAKRGWRRYGALAVLLLVAGWVLPGATEDEVQSGAGAVVASGDTDALNERGLRPTWPMVSYSLEEFLDWSGGLPLSAGDAVDVPGSVSLGLRTIQVDRDAALVLPDGRNLAKWLSETGQLRIGTATHQDWTPFVERVQTLRDRGEADFTHLSHAATAKGGGVQISVPTAIDAAKEASTPVEFLGLHVGVRPNRSEQGDEHAVVELALNVDQTVVVQRAGAKRTYEHVTTSIDVSVDNSDTAKWIYFVSDTRGSKVNVVCIRPGLASAATNGDRVAQGPPNKSEELKKDHEEKLATSEEIVLDLRDRTLAMQEGKAEQIETEGSVATLAIPTFDMQDFTSSSVYSTGSSPRVTVFEDVKFSLLSTSGGPALSFQAKRLEHTTGKGVNNVVLEGDVEANSSEFSILAERVELFPIFLFYEAILDTTSFGVTEAEQIRVDPLARQFQILNGTVDEARLKAALGDDVKNAPKGEWLTLPFAVVQTLTVSDDIKSNARSLRISTSILEVSADADVLPEHETKIAEHGENFVLLGGGVAEQWETFERACQQAVENGQARYIASPTVETLAEESASITIGKEVTAQESVPTDSALLPVTTVTATPVADTEDDGGGALSVEVEITRGYPEVPGVEGASGEKDLTRFVIAPDEMDGDWRYHVTRRDGGKPVVIVVRVFSVERDQRTSG